MLQRLKIKNLAIVEDIEIEFIDGLNIITGETGSGKSIIVNAIDLLMGAKFNKENFRDENESCILGNFIFNNESLEIKKIFNVSGNHKIFINGKQATNQELKDKTINYIDMHGQYNQHSILNKINHIDFLDNFGNYRNSLHKMNSLFLEYENNKNHLHKLRTINKDIVEKRDLYTYQLSELNDIALYKGIDQELSSQYDKISNTEDVKSSIGNLIHLMDDKDDSLKNELTKIIKILNNLSLIDNYFIKLSELFDVMKIDIGEVCYDLNLKKDEYIFDKDLFDKISSDLEQVEMIKRKYGGTIDSAISYKKKIEKYLNNFNDINEKILQMQNNISDNETQLVILSNKISNKRLKNIPLFEKNINKILNNLDMKDAILTVNLEKTDKIYNKGVDDCEFYITTNKGSKTKPVIKIASGGEISRIMLAIKILMQNKVKKNTLIFDEIDLGVSGKAAENLGNNLLELSQRTQIICISHLPQIASKGKSHYKVFKKTTNNDMTFSNVIKLNSKSRIDEIAQMLSGEQITDNSLEQAKYLLSI